MIRQLIEQERHNLLNELGEQGRRQMREEHLIAFRKEVRDSFTQQEVLQAQDQERRAIIREIQTELRRQQDASIVCGLACSSAWDDRNDPNRKMTNKARIG